MKIGFAQLNPTVGDLRGNFEKIAHAYDRLAKAGADLVLTPELAITGYPPQDLVFKSQFVPQNLEVLDRLQARLRGAALVVRDWGRAPPARRADLENVQVAPADLRCFRRGPLFRAGLQFRAADPGRNEN